MKQKGRLTRILTIVSVFCLMFAAACGSTDTAGNAEVNQEMAANPDLEFVFEGEGTASNGRTLTFKISGNKDNTMEVTVEEMPSLRMNGTWELVDGKGYKLYFEDGNNTFEYTKYDPETKEFSFTTKVNTGSYGSPEVNFTYADAAFADVYDGEGLGRKPPEFAMSGWQGAIVEKQAVLKCAEDGTFKVTGVGGVSEAWCSDRTGTWEYDEAANEYSFTFDQGVLIANDREVTEENWKIPPRGQSDAPVEDYVNRTYALGKEESEEMTWEQYVEKNYCKGPYTTTYDEATNTYTLSVDLEFIMEQITVFTGECTYVD